MLPRLLPCALVATLLPAVAFASENNAAVEACKALGEGDACTLKQPYKGDDGVAYRDVAGACQPDECCEQDYSKGSPPEVTCGPCLACTPPGPGKTVSAEPNREPPRTSDDPPAEGSSKRGCTAGGAPSWLALGFLGLAATLRRRR
ncbi:MAG: MYXO-CTERM sorting domain-containing protein [Myxococcota bacterium]